MKNINSARLESRVGRIKPAIYYWVRFSGSDVMYPAQPMFDEHGEVCDWEIFSIGYVCRPTPDNLIVLAECPFPATERKDDMKAPKEKIVSDRTWNSDQSWWRQIVAELGSERIRYTIRQNAYDFQSYGKAETWTKEGWKEVHRIPGPELRCKDVSYVEKNVKPSRFDADIEELRTVVESVMGPR